MKTLILFGSPTPRGNTMAMVTALRERLRGDTALVDLYRARIAPCVDCKRCFEAPGCAIHDDMGDIYIQLAQSDNIVIASPMHFGIVSAPMVALFSRLQTDWSARHIRGETPAMDKTGLVLASTGSQWPNMRHLLEGVTDIAFTHMRVGRVLGSVYAHHTDRVPAGENRRCREQIEAYADLLNQMRAAGSPSGARS